MGTITATGGNPPTGNPADGRGTAILCPEAPGFELGDFSSAERELGRLDAIPFGQPWQAATEPDFHAGFARVGWHGDALLVWAELSDLDVYTDATKMNQRLWELGDVFEIFLAPAGQPAYVELQVAPNNVRLQLQFPDGAAAGRLRETGDMKPYLLGDAAFRSFTWVRPSEKKWFVAAAISSSTVCEKAEPLAGQRWHFSFGRYDYARGRQEPVISTTSPLTQMDFHRRDEWRTLEFRHR